jgi:hypothetical protein
MTEQVLKAIASSFKIDADEFTATLRNEDGSDWLSTEVIASKVSGLIQEKVTAAKMASRSAGQGEENAKLAKLVKTAGFSNDENLKGAELLSAFIAWKDAQVPELPEGNDLAKLTADDLVKLPTVKSLIDDAKKTAGQSFEALKKQIADKESEFDTYKKTIERERANDALARFIPEALRKANVILKVEGVEDSEKARTSNFIELIKHTRKFTLGADGTPIFVDENGKPLEDEFGKPIDPLDVILSIAKPMYGVATQNPANGGGNPPISNGKPGEQAPPRIHRTQQEYNQFLMTETDNAKRLAAVQAWQYHENKAAGN